MLSTEIKAILQQTDDTWQVDWVETTRDREGISRSLPITLRALVTVYTTEPGSSTTDEQLRMNPMSIYVRDFYWTRIQ